MSIFISLCLFLSISACSYFSSSFHIYLSDDYDDADDNDDDCSVYFTHTQ